jgi:hypothetical protein
MSNKKGFNNWLQLTAVFNDKIAQALSLLEDKQDY